MFSPDQYQLLDFGDGRRLERLGGVVVDRPCSAAERLTPADPDAWMQAHARFDRGDGDEGEWRILRPIPDPWIMTHEAVTFELKCTSVGHVGVFPEQAANWDWIARRVRARSPRMPEPMKVLNLFAYTGGTTLAAAAAGATVAHVDAARNTVGWARRNAELSGLADRPIRWIAEDAVKFADRELRRGSVYDAVVLDPPSYGHGAHGEVWRLSKDLPALVGLCARLTAGRLQFMLLTCHTPGYDPPRLREIVLEALGRRGTAAPREMTVQAATGKRLPSGAAVYWVAEPLPPCADGCGSTV